MTTLTVLTFPDPRLRTRAKPVEKVDARIRALVKDMYETMYAWPGIGLAATQVDIHERVIVMDVGDPGESDPHCLINPEIIHKEGEMVCQEGCFSVPGIYADVQRAANVTVRALNEQGEPFELTGEGYLSACIQHEIDHLNGVLFVDYLSELKRNKVRKILAKQARKGGYTPGKSRERILK